MNLHLVQSAPQTSGIPRVSGDEPEDMSKNYKDWEYSPRERG